MARDKVAHAKYMREYRKRRYAEDPAFRSRIIERNKDDQRRWRQEVFEHYGTSCACCGEETPEFLTLDHIEGNGAEHRRSLGVSGGWPFYHALKQQGYPEGLQTPCMNCNFAKGATGHCPHEAQVKEIHADDR